MPYGDKELQDFICRHKLDAKILHLDRRVKKVEDAEETLGKDRTNIVKAMFLIADESDPILCIIRGDCQLDFRKVSDILNVSNVRFAYRKETLHHTGYDIGSIPPVGHKELIRTLVDHKVLEKRIVFGGGGSDKCLLEIKVARILEFQNANCFDIT